MYANGIAANKPWNNKLKDSSLEYVYVVYLIFNLLLMIILLTFNSKTGPKHLVNGEMINADETIANVILVEYLSHSSPCSWVGSTSFSHSNGSFEWNRWIWFLTIWKSHQHWSKLTVFYLKNIRTKKCLIVSNIYFILRKPHENR